MASLFGKLREHEIEIQRLAVQESEDQHNKSITLKASKQQPDSSESEEENISPLSRKFSKFLRKRQTSKRYDSKKPNEFNSIKYTCYDCGEQGHIKLIIIVIGMTMMSHPQVLQMMRKLIFAF